MPEDANELRSEAERRVKRGELREALALYERVLEMDPADAAALSRVKTLNEMIAGDGSQTPMRAASTEPAPMAQTAEQRAEAQMQRGDLRGALATYGELLRIRPDHQLARERHAEIEALLRASDRAAAAPRAAPVAERPGLPKERILEELLRRIAERRRLP